MAASTERVLELFRMISSDADLRDRLAGLSPAERRVILDDRGFADVTAQDVEEHKELLLSQPTGALSDDELEAVSGGAPMNFEATAPIAVATMTAY